MNKTRVFSRNFLIHHAADIGFGIALLALITFASLASDVFLTDRNVINVSRQLVTNGLISIAMLLVILTGGIDLSVGPVLAFAGLLVAGLQNTLPVPVAIAAALAVGMLIGLVNGVLIAYLRLQPFIVTLATMGAVRGGLYVYSDSPKYASSAGFMDVLGHGTILGVPTPFLVFAACLPLVWFFLNHMRGGRAIVAIGVNPEAVRLAGINVRRHVAGTYVASGFFAALAGVLLAARLGISQPSVGVGYELDAIAAVVIGGGILGGGGGSVGGMLGGVLALAFVDNILNLFDVESYYQQMLKGLIILIAVIARRRPE
jgi:ribose/xylose/arabinose/galactoside ABC-type transport system permease subunit